MNAHRALRAGLLGAALVLGGLLLAQTAQAAPALQDDGSIRGRVFFDENDDGIFDTDESPVRGVVVRLEDEDGNTDTEETSRIGIFRFDDLADGTYTVSVELDEEQADTYGDADDYEDIEVSGELVSGIDFALPPADEDGAMDDEDEDVDEEDMDDDEADDEDADDEDMDDEADDADMDDDADEDPQAVVEQLRSLLRAADEQGITVDDLDSNLRDAIQSVIDDLSEEEREAIEQAIALDLELATLAESTGAIQLLDDIDDMDDDMDEDEGMDEDEDEADDEDDDAGMDDDGSMGADSQDAAMVQDMPSTGAGDLFGWPAFLALMAVMGLLGFVGMSRERNGV